MNLHELESTRLAVQIRLDDMLEASGGEVTDEVDEIANMLLTLDEALERKLDKYAYVIKSLESDVERFADLEHEFYLRCAATKITVDRLKDRVKDYIERNVPEGKVKCELHTLSVRKNGGVLPLEIDEDVLPEDVPGMYTRQKVEFNNACIRDVLEQGVELPFARLGEQGTHLRIR